MTWRLYFAHRDRVSGANFGQNPRATAGVRAGADNRSACGDRTAPEFVRSSATIAPCMRIYTTMALPSAVRRRPRSAWRLRGTLPGELCLARAMRGMGEVTDFHPSALLHT